MSERSEEAVTARSEEHFSDRPGFESGQRLYCPACTSEIEIANPSGADPANQEFSCCGMPMKPNTGVQVHLHVEG